MTDPPSFSSVRAEGRRRGPPNKTLEETQMFYESGIFPIFAAETKNSNSSEGLK
jgi:hypothetical protein